MANRQMRHRKTATIGIPAEHREILVKLADSLGIKFSQTRQIQLYEMLFASLYLAEDERTWNRAAGAESRQAIAVDCARSIEAIRQSALKEETDGG